MDETVSTMESLYGKATIPEYGDNNSNKTLSLEPGTNRWCMVHVNNFSFDYFDYGLFFFLDINDIFDKSYDVNELKHVWVQWREATGKKVRSMYTDYVKLSNEAAVLNS